LQGQLIYPILNPTSKTYLGYKPGTMGAKNAVANTHQCIGVNASMLGYVCILAVVPHACAFVSLKNITRLRVTIAYI
jgi:hypothetical protein